MRRRPGMVPALVLVIMAAGVTARTSDWLRVASDSVFDEVRAAAGRHLGRVAGYLRERLDSPMPDAALGSTYVLVVSDGVTVGLDRTACVTETGESCGLCGLPAITGLLPQPRTVGDRMWTPGVALGFSILAAFECSAGLADMVSEVDVSDLDNPRAVLCGGTSVDLGKGGYPRKARRLMQVLGQLDRIRTRAKRIDLRFAGQAVVEYDGSHHGFEKEV
jgi:hypothetical protein